MAENFAETTRTVDFKLGVEMALAEDRGIFRPKAMQDTHTGNKKVEITDRFSRLQGYDIEERNSKTSHIDPDVERRWISKPKRHAVPVIIDPDDQAATQVGLKSPLSMGVADAIRMKHDDAWLEGFYGNALTGEEGTQTVPFKAANVLAADYGETAANYTGLTYAKMLQVQFLRRRRFARITPGDMPHCAITAYEIKDLFGIDRYINGDYRSPELKPLENGEPSNFLGITWVPAEIDSAANYPKGSLVAVNSSGHRRLPFWLPSGMHFGVWTEFDGRDDIRPDLHHSEQIAGYTCVKATRLHEDKCFIIEVNGT